MIIKKIMPYFASVLAFVAGIMTGMVIAATEQGFMWAISL